MPDYDERPTDRALRVERIKADVEEGVYDVPSSVVANAMIEHLMLTACGDLLPDERAFIAETWTRPNREAAANIQRAQIWRQKRARLDAAVQDAPARETFQQRQKREGRFVLALIVGAVVLFIALYAWYLRKGG